MKSPALALLLLCSVRRCSSSSERRGSVWCDSDAEEAASWSEPRGAGVMKLCLIGSPQAS